MSFLAIAVSYLMGSIPFGFLVCKYWKGINILEHGSGNIGFTNVLRTVGWLPALFVLIGDIAKGAAAAWVGTITGGETVGILCGTAALLGHSFSVFLRFRGGKLVSTGLGVLLVLATNAALTAAFIWLSTLALTRYVSLASILAAIGMFPAMLIFDMSTGMRVFLSLAALFIIFRHRSNIRKLLRGQEYKIGQKVDRK